DPGDLPLVKGFTLGLGPSLASVVGLAVGLGLLGAGRRRGGWSASGRRCRHGRTPREREGGGIGGPAPRPCAGEAAGKDSLLQRGTTRRREGVPGAGSPVRRPKTLPDSESHTGKTPRRLSHHSPARVATHTASAQDS